MSKSSQQELDALDELIESHLHKLFQMLSKPHTLAELREEVNTLNDLLSSFSRRNELIEMLQDGLTTEEKREHIREMLRAQRIQFAESQEETARSREKSDILIKRGMGLVDRAQRIINKQAYKHTGYAIEVCGLCKGLRYIEGERCAACKGEGTVLVRQPARKCMRCKGSGIEINAPSTVSRVCAICSGTGWTHWQSVNHK